MWRLWPLFRRLWAAVGTIAAGLAIKDLFAVWTNQSVPDIERLSRFQLGHWYWAGGGMTLFAIVSVVAARAHRRHKAPRFIGVRRAAARARERSCRRSPRPSPHPANGWTRGGTIATPRMVCVRAQDERRVVFVTGEVGWARPPSCGPSSIRCLKVERCASGALSASNNGRASPLCQCWRC